MQVDKPNFLEKLLKISCNLSKYLILYDSCLMRQFVNDIKELIMSRVCAVCGKGKMNGHLVSHSNKNINKTQKFR